MRWFKKKNEEISYYQQAKWGFSRNNKFVQIILDMVEYRMRYEGWIEEIESGKIKERSFSCGMDDFQLTFETKDYLGELLECGILIKKCREIIWYGQEKSAEHLVNLMVEAVCILQELGKSCEKGVPIQYPEVIQAVEFLKPILKRQLEEYYRLNVQDLAAEIKVAEKMRIEYQIRKKTFNEFSEKLDISINSN